MAARQVVDEGYGPGGVTAQQAPCPSAHPAPSSSRVVEMMDRAVARVLCGQPRPLGPWEAVATTSSRPFETALLVSAVRCTVRYIVLPLVLLGVATSAALGILLTVGDRGHRHHRHAPLNVLHGRDS